MRLPFIHLSRTALGFVFLLGPSSALPLSPLAQEELTKAAPIQKAERWTEREVEHLFNRAGFGANLGEIRRWKKRGRAELIDHLFDRPGPSSEFPVRNFRVDRGARAKAGPDERIELDRKVRREDRKQVHAFAEWWLDQMVLGRDPLRERMTLILHGWMVSSHDKVRQGDYLIRQNFLFRQHALGNYGDLLGHIVEDPAMLLYLDNTSNRKNKPNENLARELLELFSLGEGNYTEQDIKDAARALTGYTVRFDDFYYVLRIHDRESKTVLGDDTVGDAIDLVRVILEQPACAEYVARRVISELEGVEPTTERTAHYAEILRSGDYEFEPMLRALFADPEFYRDAVVGTKVL